MSRKLKASEVAGVRAAIAKKLVNCPLCGTKFNAAQPPVLDHDHSTGYIRDALCRNCNGIEGRIENRVVQAARGSGKIEWVTKLIEYWVRHRNPQWGGLIHPTHKTDEEKRLLRNKRARERRAALKGAK